MADDQAVAGGCRHATVIRPPCLLGRPHRPAPRRVRSRAGRAPLRADRARGGSAGPPTAAGGAGVLCGRRRPGAVPFAARRPADPGTPIRPTAPAMAGRAPGRRPGRPGGRGDPQRRAGHCALRGPGGRPPRGHRGARRWAADHPRAGTAGRAPRPAGHRRRAAGRAAAGASGLPDRSVPALGSAPGRRIPGPAGTARPRSGATVRGRRHRRADRPRRQAQPVSHAARRRSVPS